MKIDKSLVALATTFTVALAIGQSVNACRWTRVHRSFTNTTSHHSYSIGSTHTLSTSRGSVTLQVQQRSLVEGFHIPNGAMGRLGYSAEVNSGTACY